MNSKKPKYYELNQTLEPIAKHLALNQRLDIVIEVCSKLFPVSLSALIATYSIITTSFFYGLSYTLYYVALCILMAIVMLVISMGPFMVMVNGEILTELKVTRKVSRDETKENSYIMRTFYVPEFQFNLRAAIQKTIDDLLSTSFVIFFPAGIADILLGFVGNMPSIGIVTINQVITGAVFLIISCVLLFLTIKHEYRKTKINKGKSTIEMKNLLAKVQSELEKSPSVIVDFAKTSR